MLGFVALAKIALADDAAEQNYSFVADQGAFAVTGQAAALQFGDNFVALEGSFNATGQDANLNRSLIISADAASFATTGNDASLGRAIPVEADQGLFSTAGQDADFDINFDATVDLVAYSVSVDSGANEYGTGNKFYVSGSPDASPTLRLQPGITYRFDQSDSSNSGHPFKFSTTADGTHNSGSEYTTGVTVVGIPGSAGAYVEIEVTVSTPTLYYYCDVHSGMGGLAETDAKLYNVTSQEAVFATAMLAASGALSLSGQASQFAVSAPAEAGTFTTAGQVVAAHINFIAASGSFNAADQDTGLNYKPQASFDAGTFTSAAQTASFVISRLTEGGSFILTGLPHNKAISEAARHVSLSYSGQSNQFNIRLTADAGAFATTGQAADLLPSMPADAGNFAATGQEATFFATLSMAADVGVLTETGQDAVFNTRSILASETFTSIGQDASFAINFVTEGGSLSSLGQDAAIVKDMAVDLDAGALGLNGQDISANINFVSGSGAFSVAGQDVIVTKDLIVAPQAANFALVGQDALKGISEIASDVEYTFAGQSVSFNVNLSANSGLFALAGQDALKEVVELIPTASFAFSGQDAVFKVQVTVIVDSATFALAVQDARPSFVFNRFEFDGYEQRSVFSKSGTIDVNAGLANSVDIEAVDQNDLEVYDLTANSVIVQPTYNKAA